MLRRAVVRRVCIAEAIVGSNGVENGWKAFDREYCVAQAEFKWSVHFYGLKTPYRSLSIEVYLMLRTM